MSLAFEKDTEVDLIESVKSGFDLMASIESEIDWVNSTRSSPSTKEPE